MIRSFRFATCAVAAFVFIAAGCSDAPTAPDDSVALAKGGLPTNSLPTIVDIAVGDPTNFSILTDLVVRADLAGTLSGNRPFTVFAPTNTAFLNAGIPSADAVCGVAPNACPEAVVDILLYHVTNGVRLSSSVTGVRKIRMLNGGDIYPDGTVIGTSSGGSANLVLPLIDIAASNGVVHVVDAVLLP